MSSDSPNSQNVSKKLRTCRACKGAGEVGENECRVCKGEGEVSYSLRRAFRPPPGFELWAFDYENIELVIPAYECHEPKMIELFERPDDPPFFGSYHLLCASIAYPDLFWPIAEKKGEFKKRYAATWYQWIKNTDFAKSYGAGRAKVDTTARKAGVYDAINAELGGLTALSEYYVNFARKYGYVETIPDKTVDPRRGYPIMTSRGGHSRDVSPTIPFNYHVSGTACWGMRKAMPRVHNYLAEVSRTTQQEHRICVQVHDELLCLFPAGGRRNLPKARMVKSLMEKSGDDIGIPLRVSMSWHPKSWAENESYEAKEAA
jgi:DNA polymerase I-like protein with 3'-5' exonuclease and polymerase domains